MSQTSLADQFLRERRPIWEELNTLLEGKGLSKRSPADVSRVFELHREVCGDLIRAQTLGCTPTTLRYLDGLVSRSHSELYAHSGRSIGRIGDILRRQFPRALRNNARLFLLSNLLFWLPFAIAVSNSLISANFAAQVLPIETLERMAEAYQNAPSKGRTPDGSAAMAGFYVYNNVGIAFRCFATGILFGLGSAFFLVYNGAVTGAIVGHVIRTGGGPNILTFVSGHAPLELTAIVIAGAAGLQMGNALINTSGQTRLRSLWNKRDPIVAQVLGAATMLILAAGVEAFWSPSRVPAEGKWIASGLVTLGVVAYLVFSGRPDNEQRGQL